jgi:hypothetical protein
MTAGLQQLTAAVHCRARSAHYIDSATDAAYKIPAPIIVALFDGPHLALATANRLASLGAVVFWLRRRPWPSPRSATESDQKE